MQNHSSEEILANGMIVRKGSLPNSDVAQTYAQDIHYDTSKEKEPLLRRTSTPTVVLIEEDQELPPSRRLSDVVIAFLVLLVAESARGIVLPTLAPYVDMIGGNPVILGYAVAAFSIGRFASTIGLGYLSTRLSYRTVLGWSVFFCLVGNALYAFGTVGGVYVLLVSRFITGFGAGTLSVVRAYVAHVTTRDERTSFMSILGAVQFLGFAITPGLGSILAYVPDYASHGIAFNKYTNPGWFLAVANLIILAILLWKFQNPPPNQATVVSVSVAINAEKTEVQSVRKTLTMWKIFAVFLTLNLLVRLVLGIIETLGTPMCIF